jgi:hypothetical protein
MEEHTGQSYDEEIAVIVERHADEGWKNLRPDFRAFAHAYLESYSHVKAAQVIGKPGLGLRYMRDPVVAAYIVWLQDKYQADNLISENFVAQKLLEIIPKLAGEEDVEIVGRNGEVMTAKKFHAAELIAALKDLSRFARYTESVESVESALARQALGGSTEAAKFFLKNRKPDAWKDKVEQNLTGADGGIPTFRMIVGSPGDEPSDE